MIKKTSFYITLFLFTIALSCSSKKQLLNEEIPLTSPESEWLSIFVRYFNTGKNNSIIEFTKAYSGEPSYLMALYKEIGPISYKLEDEGAFWFQGIITKAWVGFVIRKSEDNKYYISGVRRGIRPLTAKLPASIGIDNWEEYFYNYLSKSASQNFFSGAILIAKKEQIIFEGSFGFADRAENKLNTLNTPFNLASVTKIFTGVAIARLVQEGKLKFEDPISKYIPEFPSHIGNKVTIHHLLTHTSGIELDDYGPYNDALAEANSLNEILSVQLKYIKNLNGGNYDNFETLKRFDYTNEGIDLLGIIIERSSGITWQQFIQEKIFNQASMKNSGLLASSSLIKGIAKGYSLRNESLNGWVTDKRREVSYDDSALRFLSKTARPAGSGYSTIHDMLNFSLAFQNGTLVDKEFVDIITSPHIEMLPLGGIERSYGYTFESAKSNSLLSFGHKGGAPGMNTSFEIYPKEGITVIVLSNYDNSAAIHVSEHIRELILSEVIIEQK